MAAKQGPQGQQGNPTDQEPVQIQQVQALVNPGEVKSSDDPTQKKQEKLKKIEELNRVNYMMQMQNLYKIEHLRQLQKIKEQKEKEAENDD